MLTFAPYIGLPFKDKGRDRTGLDCWGLVSLVLLEQFQIEVPSYTEGYSTSLEGQEVAALIVRESVDWPVMPLPDARAGDVLILKIHGLPWHCGLVLDPPYFLHTTLDTGGAVMERWDGLLWARRIVAVHRHPSRVEGFVCL